jgi:hypothetical protein
MGELACGSGLENGQGMRGSGADVFVGIFRGSFECADGLLSADSSQGFRCRESDIAVEVGECFDEGFHGRLASVVERFGHERGIRLAVADFANAGQCGGGGLADPILLVFEGGFQMRDGLVSELSAWPGRFDQLQGSAGCLADGILRIGERHDERRDRAWIIDQLQCVHGCLANLPVGVLQQGNQRIDCLGITKSAE